MDISEESELEIKKSHVEIEKTKVRLDAELKKQELELRKRELDKNHEIQTLQASIKKSEAETSRVASLRKFTPAVATAIGAITGLIGAVAGATITGIFQSQSLVDVEREKAIAAITLEKTKFETDLITQAVDTTE